MDYWVVIIGYDRMIMIFEDVWSFALSLQNLINLVVAKSKRLSRKRYLALKEFSEMTKYFTNKIQSVYGPKKQQNFSLGHFYIVNHNSLEHFPPVFIAQDHRRWDVISSSSSFVRSMNSCKLDQKFYLNSFSKWDQAC